eukprot:5154363-Prymnesium_polylepis.1
MLNCASAAHKRSVAPRCVVPPGRPRCASVPRGSSARRAPCSAGAPPDHALSARRTVCYLGNKEARTRRIQAAPTRTRMGQQAHAFQLYARRTRALRRPERAEATPKVGRCAHTAKGREGASRTAAHTGDESATPWTILTPSLREQYLSLPP